MAESKARVPTFAASIEQMLSAANENDARAALDKAYGAVQGLTALQMKSSMGDVLSKIANDARLSGQQWANAA